MFYHDLQEQVELSARKQKNYSKAAIQLLLEMFTEEERKDGCLYDCQRKHEKKTGTKLEKKGLEDKEKLSPLHGK